MEIFTSSPIMSCRLTNFECPNTCYLVKPPIVHYLNNVCKFQNIDMVIHRLDETVVWELPEYIGKDFDTWMGVQLASE